MATCGACSETRDDDPDSGITTPPVDAGTAARDAGGGTPVDAGTTMPVDASTTPVDAPVTPSDAGTIPSGSLVLNEMAAAGDDWIELYNTGSTALDLSGYRVSDRAADGTPRIDMAITLPAGTMLGGGEYLLIVADLGAMAMPGPQTMCLPASGPPNCFHAPWGLSRDGDTVTVFDAAMTIVASEAIPSGTMDGQTWGRLPNGTGGFAIASPTPGAVNAAP